MPKYAAFVKITVYCITHNYHVSHSHVPRCYHMTSPLSYVKCYLTRPPPLTKRTRGDRRRRRGTTSTTGRHPKGQTPPARHIPYLVGGRPLYYPHRTPDMSQWLTLVRQAAILIGRSNLPRPAVWCPPLVPLWGVWFLLDPPSSPLDPSPPLPLEMTRSSLEDLPRLTMGWVWSVAPPSPTCQPTPDTTQGPGISSDPHQTLVWRPVEIHVNKKGGTNQAVPSAPIITCYHRSILQTNTLINITPNSTTSLIPLAPVPILQILIPIPPVLVPIPSFPTVLNH